MAVRIDGKPVLLKVRQVSRRPCVLEVIETNTKAIEQLKELAAWVLPADLDLRPFYRLAVRGAGAIGLLG